MFNFLPLAFVTLAPSVSLASEFFVKIFPSGNALAAAVLDFNNGAEKVWCDVRQIDSGNNSLTTVYDCLKISDDEQIRIVALKAPSAKRFSGMLTHSSASGIANIEIQCAADARGFMGCQIK